jgi:hypothetical protein
MPEKVVGSPAEAAGSDPPPSHVPRPPEAAAPAPAPDTIKHDDGITNPRDGRGPLRPRDDQAVKLPLRPPH